MKENKAHYFIFTVSLRILRDLSKVMGTCGFMVYYTYKEYQSEQSYTYTFSSAAYVYKKVCIIAFLIYFLLLIKI